MDGGVHGIGIPQHAPTSPRPNTSTLTSALQATSGNELRSTPGGSNAMSWGKPAGSGRHDSISMSGLTPQYTSGAVPITGHRNSNAQGRRESNAGSIMSGMSLGGISMNSWIRDDIIMQGSSPYANGYQSPSYHSSSYMPKLEAQFMKDFNCCGIILASLHDLVQHYEEAHAQIPNQPPMRTTAMPNSTAGNVAPSTQGTAGPQQPGRGAPQMNISQMNISGHEAAMASQQHMQPKAEAGMQHGRANAPPPAQDMEAVEDMEMDDGSADGANANMAASTTHDSLPYGGQNAPYGQRSHYGPPSARMPGLNLDTMQHENPLQNFQGIRQSQPNTPVAGSRPAPVFHNNPTVSSVNTPTLSTHPRHPRQLVINADIQTPDSSAPGTPRELDPDFVGGVGNMSMDNGGQFFPGGPGYSHAHGGGGGGGVAYGYAPGANGISQLYIDEPAKALAHPPGGGAAEPPNQVMPGKNRLGSAHYGPDSPLAKTIREQQRKVGLADTVEGINGGEPKPFRCPVIGCEKAYKNQNGLKYHKANGHKTQQLQENADGTYSIVDPTTRSPYPGTLGMEKDKPYKCESCGKRYKNLNGLKYHRTHFAPCNPNADPSMAGAGGMPAGAGLMLDEGGEEM